MGVLGALGTAVEQRRLACYHGGGFWLEEDSTRLSVMCVQCAMGAAAGFGLLQAYRYVIKDRAHDWLSMLRGASVDSQADTAADTESRSERSRKATAA